MTRDDTELDSVRRGRWEEWDLSALAPPARALAQIRLAERGTVPVPCPECGEPMAYDGYGETLVGFFSDPGHHHDDNCLSAAYKCPGGHVMTVHLRRRCPHPDCDWVGKETCFCHCGPKVDRLPHLPA